MKSSLGVLPCEDRISADRSHTPTSSAELLFLSTSKISRQAKSLLRSLLKENAAERLQVAQIKNHPWVRRHLSQGKIDKLKCAVVSSKIKVRKWCEKLPGITARTTAVSSPPTRSEIHPNHPGCPGWTETQSLDESSFGLFLVVAIQVGNPVRCALKIVVRADSLQQRARSRR